MLERAQNILRVSCIVYRRLSALRVMRYAMVVCGAFFLFAPHDASAAITRVQTVANGNSGATTVAATWPGATTAGDLLVAIIAVRGGTGTTITPPAGLGWTLAGSRSNNGTTISTAIYYISNAASQSGASTWTITSARATLTLAEYSGAVTATTLDVTTTATGTGTTGDTGTTGTTAYAGEVSVGGMSVANSNGTWSAPTNGYALVSQVVSSTGTASAKNNTGFFEKIPGVTAAERVQATSATSAAWAGVIATFKPRIVTIGVTAGSQQANVNSGTTSQTINDPACTAASSCSAFTLTVNAGAATLTSFKVTETGTVSASTDLSNAKLYYDTDGNYANGTIGQFGSTIASYTTETATFSGSLAMTSGNTYYFYVMTDVKSGTPTYPKAGELIDVQVAANGDVVITNGTTTGATQSLAGSTKISPDATAVSYPTSPDGAISGQSVTVTGFGFGVATAGANRADCTTATVDVGCVKFTVGGTTNVASGDITAWSNTSITFTVNAALASDGGASSIEVRGANQADASKLTFYVYPNITALVAVGTNAGREYAATDTDGLVMLSGDHFGAAGTVTILGSSATQHAATEGSCTTGGYASTTACYEIPPAISDSTYTGNIVLTRTSDSKTFTFSNLRILPRILTNAPTSGAVGSTVQVLGNHFCETGTCPVSPNRSSASNNVQFGSTQTLDADFQNVTGGGTCAGAGAAWTHTEICVKVPSGTPTGSQPTKVTSNALISNTVAFSRTSTTPNDPVIGPGTNKGQYKIDTMTVISVGGTTPEASVVFKADMTATIAIPMALQLEKQPVGTGFTCGAGACGAAVEGTIGGGGACASCTTLTAATLTIGSLSDNSYHWQARAKNTTTNEYSNWVSFGGNVESQSDFNIDTTAPAITSLSCGTPGTTSMTITWNTSSEASTSQVQENLTGTFGACSGDCTTLDATPVFSHSVLLSSLTSSTTYFFRARSVDAIGNEMVSATQSCTTATAAPTYTATGSLESTTFDTTGTADGASYNSILWRGNFGGPSQNIGHVRFQLATSASSTGPWNYVGGGTCTAGDWFDPGAPDTPVELNCPTAFNGNRYFRYKVQLCADDCSVGGSYTPQVDDVVVSWSP